MSSAIPIKCDQTGRVFDTISQAAKEMGLPGGNLNRHVNGDPQRTHVGGYTFTKVTETEAAPEEEIVVSVEPLKTTKPRTILCYETLQVFPSINQAAKALGLNTSNVTAHINGKASHSHVGGYTFAEVTLEF